MPLVPGASDLLLAESGLAEHLKRAAAVGAASAEVQNIHAILELERTLRERRSAMERLIDRVSGLASSPAFITIHVVWFAAWILGNSTGLMTFDRSPFNLLALSVALEAIILAAFVLMAQQRMTRQAEQRAHLELQINLLAEQELTAMLKLQCLLAERAGIDLTRVDPKLDQFRSRTDVQHLAATIDLERDAETVSSTPPIGEVAQD